MPEVRQAPPPRLVDVDRDGTVSHAEALTYYDALFAFLDRNRDGTVIRAEFSQALMPERSDADERQALHERLRHLFGTLDGDSDEKLSPVEFSGACDQHYDISDFDGDGTVSVSEFRSRGL